MLHSTFAAHRGESIVPTMLTLLVSGWFLAAGGAVLADRASPAKAAEPVQHTAVVCASPLTVRPDTHETITVEAQRG